MFAVDDIYDVVARLRTHVPNSSARSRSTRTSSRLCFLRGPEGIIIGLAEQPS